MDKNIENSTEIAQKETQVDETGTERLVKQLDEAFIPVYPIQCSNILANGQQCYNEVSCSYMKKKVCIACWRLLRRNRSNMIKQTKLEALQR